MGRQLCQFGALRLRPKAQGLEVLRERIQPLHDLYSELLERAEHWADKLRDRARFEAADSESLRETIHQAQDAVRSAQSGVDVASESMGEIRVGKAQLEVQVTAAIARIVEDLGVPIERALDAEPIEDRAAAVERAHRLRKRMANLGPVNPVAVEEFEGLAKRRDFMQTQLDDLVSSRKALQKVVSAIDRRRRRPNVDRGRPAIRARTRIVSDPRRCGAVRVRSIRHEAPDRICSRPR